MSCIKKTSSSSEAGNSFHFQTFFLPRQTSLLLPQLVCRLGLTTWSSSGIPPGLLLLFGHLAARLVFFQVVWKTKRLLCKCHGVSGACSLRTCWQTLHMFRKVGKIIKKKYERAMKIVMSQHQNGLIVANGRREPPPKSVLVFFEDSPDYCRVDSQTGKSWRLLMRSETK